MKYFHLFMKVELLETVYVVDGRFFNHLVVLLKREILSTSINRYVECANELYKENAINVFQWISRKPGRKKIQKVLNALDDQFVLPGTSCSM